MITGSLSLALFTVVFRRVFDSVTGRIPTVSPPTSHNTTAFFVVSGVLYYLYSHLKRGTLVKIGQGASSSNPSCSYRVSSQRRIKNNKSWFLKSIWGSRRNCTDAICRIAKQSFESVTNLNPCLLLPKKTFRISFPNNQTPSRSILTREKISRSCDIIYNNEVFEKDSATEIHQNKDNTKERVETVNNGVQEKGRKKEKLALVKRLDKGRKPLTGTASQKSANKLERACRTRSGKVYSCAL